MSRKFSIAVHAHEDGVHDAPPKISSVLQVNDDGAMQLLELTVAAADGGPISPNVARNIDFALLSAALNSIVAATLPPAEGGLAAAAGSVLTAPVENGAAPGTAVAATKERPYRRMPDVDEVKAVMQSTQSVGKVARHFDVPRYTAQAWIDRLRRAGQIDEAHAANLVVDAADDD